MFLTYMIAVLVFNTTVFLASYKAQHVFLTYWFGILIAINVATIAFFG